MKSEHDDWKVGHLAKHVVMGWEGVIVLDLRGNKYSGNAEQWLVAFNVDGVRKVIPVAGVELTQLP